MSLSSAAAAARLVDVAPQPSSTFFFGRRGLRRRNRSRNFAGMVRTPPFEGPPTLLKAPRRRPAPSSRLVVVLRLGRRLVVVPARTIACVRFFRARTRATPAVQRRANISANGSPPRRRFRRRPDTRGAAGASSARRLSRRPWRRRRLRRRPTAFLVVAAALALVGSPRLWRWRRARRRAQAVKLLVRAHGCGQRCSVRVLYSRRVLGVLSSGF